MQCNLPASRFEAFGIRSKPVEPRQLVVLAPQSLRDPLSDWMKVVVPPHAVHTSCIMSVNRFKEGEKGAEGTNLVGLPVAFQSGVLTFFFDTRFFSPAFGSATFTLRPESLTRAITLSFLRERTLTLGGGSRF